MSIEQYNLFIQDLGKNQETEILERASFAPTNWVYLLSKEDKKKYATQQSIYDKNGNVTKNVWVLNTKKFKPGNPNSEDFPIQNISWDAAKEYCKWITRVYNSSTSRKKKFKKVIFRLPTEQEWEEAAIRLIAKDGKRDAYPWGANAYHYQNTEGCYLLNCNAGACDDCDKIGHDGAIFTAMVDAYFPNPYGLYNMSGNVAEMTQNKAIIKGGGWQDGPEDCKINISAPNNAPSPNIGFRVFMEVIEE